MEIIFISIDLEFHFVISIKVKAIFRGVLPWVLKMNIPFKNFEPQKFPQNSNTSNVASG